MTDQPVPSPDRPLRVLLAEDHHVVRRALRSFLERQERVVVVGEVSDGDQLLAQVDSCRPDVLVMDLSMPHHRPVPVTRQLRERYPQLKLLVLSAYKTAGQVVALFEAGVDGYILKDDPPDTLLQALRQVVAGRNWISPQVAALLATGLRTSRAGALPDLTRRQQEVLSLMARGYRNEQIADKLFLSEHTIRNHISHIFQKLDVETRVEAVVYSLALGLVTLEEVRTEMEGEWPGI